MLQTAYFIGDCRYLIEHGTSNDTIKNMVNIAKSISYKQFSKICGKLDNNTILEIKSDLSAGFYKSILNNKEVYFYQYAGFEFIYIVDKRRNKYDYNRSDRNIPMSGLCFRL